MWRLVFACIQFLGILAIVSLTKYSKGLFVLQVERKAGEGRHYMGRMRYWSGRNWCCKQQFFSVLVFLLLLLDVRGTSTTTDDLQQELLKFLGMSRPARTGPLKVPGYMHQLHKEQQTFNYGSESNFPSSNFHYRHSSPPDTVRSIANITEIGEKLIILFGSYILWWKSCFIWSKL